MTDKSIQGIFTSKDVVLRVLAAGKNPATIKILDVMTPHPETVSRTTTVVEALRKMHAGRYLHLPVVDESGALEGLVDVLRLTYSTLDQLKGFKAEEACVETGETGPLWDRFFFGMTSQSGSEVSIPHRSRSDSRSRTERTSRVQTVMSDQGSVHPGMETNFLCIDESASFYVGSPTTSTPITNSKPPLPIISAPPIVQAPTIVQAPPIVQSPPTVEVMHEFQPLEKTIVKRIIIRPQSSISLSTQMTSTSDDDLFVYKLKEPNSTRIYRFVSSSRKYTEVLGAVKERFGKTSGKGIKGVCRLSYKDGDGDYVLMSGDSDLELAVHEARGLGWKKLMLSVEFVKVRDSVGPTFSNEAVGTLGMRSCGVLMGVVVGGSGLIVLSFLFGRLWQEFS